MSKKTPQSTAAGKANVARTTTNTTIQDTPVFHIGLDVHAADFTAAIAEPGRDGEVRELGTFTCDLHALEKLMARFARRIRRACCTSRTRNGGDRLMALQALAMDRRVTREASAKPLDCGSLLPLCSASLLAVRRTNSLQHSTRKPLRFGTPKDPSPAGWLR